MTAETGGISLYLFVILVTGCGTWTDLKYHKIYNKLTIPAVLAGILSNLLLGGIGGMFNSFLGIMVVFLIVPLWLLGILKGGDIKLYMAVGAIVGWQFCSYTMIFSVLIGGLAAVFMMIIRRTGRASLKRLKGYLFQLLYTKRFYTYQPDEKNAYFSFGCCIFSGTLAALWYMKFR